MQAPIIIRIEGLNDYLEAMSKVAFQPGMSWKVVDAKWPGIKEAFHGFDVESVADMRESDLDELPNDARVILGTSVGLGQRISLLVSAAVGLTDQSPDFQFTVSLPMTFDWFQ